MKKVIVLAAVVGLFAVPAIAAITGTKHDLSSTNITNTYSSSDVDEICVYCHTPHGGTSVNDAPLWNRTTQNIDAGKVYNGVDIQATYDDASYNASDAPLCLSCHDGASLTVDLTNPPNIGGVQTQPDMSGSGNIVTAGNLTKDLSNDHPIGFDYATINALDPEIKTLADAKIGGANFYGAGSNMMWCSSCHDVHGGEANTPFLLVDNAGSALCLACHDK